jgi:hypothetical protein
VRAIARQRRQRRDLKSYAGAWSVTHAAEKHTPIQSAKTGHMENLKENPAGGHAGSTGIYPCRSYEPVLAGGLTPS